MEKLASSRLTGSQHCVIQALIRKTFGWQKAQDQISGSQLAKETGIDRTRIVKIVTHLTELKIIYKISQKKQPNLLSINLNTEGWLCGDRISVSHDTTQDSDPQVTNPQNAVQIKASSSEVTHTNNIEIYTPVTQSFLDEIRNKHDFLQGGQHE